MVIKKEEVYSVFRDYLYKMDSDYAIMINGKWGAGKTFFWQTELKGLVEESIFQEEEDDQNELKYEAIYISLFGLSDINELNTKLFVELNPIWKKKGVKIAANLTKVVVSKALSGLGVDTIKEEDYNFFIKDYAVPKNKVLCFDDLERLDNKILNEVFGYINMFTEHDKVKVLILCNEEEIYNKVHNYGRIKEKLVRFTYNFNPNIFEVYESFTKAYEQSYQEFLISKKDFISELYVKGQHSNLRTLKFNLDIFENVFDYIEQNTELTSVHKTEILNRFLFFITTYSIEYKIEQDKSKLDLIEKVNSLNSLNIAALNIRNSLKNDSHSKNVQSKEKSYDELFREKYLPFQDNVFVYYKVLAIYVHTGILNNEELLNEAQEIEKSINTLENSKEYKLLKRFKNLFDLEDDEFAPVLGELIQYVKDGAYDLFTYPSLFIELLKIEKSGIMDFKITDAMLDSFRAGIKLGKAKSMHISSFNVRLPALDEVEVRYEEIKNLTIEANESLRITTTTGLSEIFEELLKTKDAQSIFDFLSDNDHKFEPIFQFLEPQQILDLILELPNKSKGSLDLGLQRRYKHINLEVDLYKELPFFTKFSDLLKGFLLTNSSKSISSELLNDLLLTVDKIKNSSK